MVTRAKRAEGPLGKWVWSPEKRERWVTEGKMVLSILGYLIRKQTCPPISVHVSLGRDFQI